MEFDPAELDTLSRDELILRARARGVERPEQMTRVELKPSSSTLISPNICPRSSVAMSRASGSVLMEAGASM